MTANKPLTETLQGLPPEWPETSLPWIRANVASHGEKLVVIDDDPTGTQTVQGVSVLTDWCSDSIRAELESDIPAFFIVTNSRSMPLTMAKEVNYQVGRNLKKAIDGFGQRTAIFSRGDSTLRGHYPGEVDALVQGLGVRFDARILIPFLLEGGRYTIDDVHYVLEGKNLIPTGHTEFARDPIFKYRSSNMRQWVAEVSDGKISPKQVESISIQGIRNGGPDGVATMALEFKDGQVCIINAASMRDIEIVIHGLMIAEAQGKRFLYRTAASAIKTRIGQDSKALLTSLDLGLPNDAGGLIVVGSHVDRTTAQLNKVLKKPGIRGIEVNVGMILEEAEKLEIDKIAQQANWYLSTKRNVIIYTSRSVSLGADIETNLEIGQRISDCLVSIVSAITVRPRYIVSKGGMTTSNVSAKALGVKRAFAIGQILPGIPTWRLGPETRFPGIVLVVFPGNVGDPGALLDMINLLATPGC